MPFCASCGSAVEGKFCPKCGAPMGAAAPADASPTPAYSAPQAQVASAGMEDNMAGALCYILGFITAIVFLVLEPYNKRPFVRFHAFQSLFFSLGWIALSIALSIVFLMMGMMMHGLWLIFLPIRLIIGLLGFLLWLFCMYKAYNREMWIMPIVGPFAQQQASKQ